MDERNLDRQMTEGLLPASAPLANPYVPFQRENPPRYDARKGIVRGTMYPGLDLPFMGMVNNRELANTPLSDLQTLAFALQDLALYLDTHRDDKQALQLYRDYQQIYHKGMMEYGERYGQLTHANPGKSNDYDWLDDPWPWEYGKK